MHDADTRHTTASHPDDPALLRIEGPIATITLNRPAAFNSIDLSIAKKLEQLGAEVEANDDIRVLVIEGDGRAFCAGGDLQTIGAAAAADTIAPVVGELLQALSRVHRNPAADAEDRAVQRSRLRRRRRHGPRLCRRSLHRGRRRPLHASLCQDRRVARRRQHRRHGRHASAPAAPCRYFWPRTIFRRSRRMIGAWSPRSFRRQNSRPRRANSRIGWRKIAPAAIGGTKSLIYQAAVTPTRAATRCRGREDHRLPCTPTNSASR